MSRCSRDIAPHQLVHQAPTVKEAPKKHLLQLLTYTETREDFREKIRSYTGTIQFTERIQSGP